MWDVKMTDSDQFGRLYCSKLPVLLLRETVWIVVDQEDCSKILITKSIETGFEKGHRKEKRRRKGRIILTDEDCIGGNAK